MNTLTIEALTHIDWWTVIIGIITGVIAFKFLCELFEWVIDKFGIETKSMRQKREDHKLLEETSKLAKVTAENLNKLQSRHCKDEEEFRRNLNNHIEESKKDRKTLHDEMIKFTSNRISDRQQSLSIQKELTDSIKSVVEGQIERDKKIENLTELFVDKQISDYRWEIINLADKISNGKIVSKECLKHAIATHAKYEKIIEKYGLVNGEVDISIGIIKSSLQKLLSENI